MLDRLSRYLNETLGLVVGFHEWPTGNRLPAYLRDSYQFTCATILGHEYVFAIDRQASSPSPSVIARHIEAMRSSGAVDIVYVQPAMNALVRKRLIALKIPFIVPGNQLYLPTSGLDLREYYRRSRPAPRRLSPAAQSLLLRIMLANDTTPLTTRRALEYIDYSAMTLTRIFDELVRSDLATCGRRGRKMELHFTNHGRRLWDSALRFLSSPVQSSIVVEAPTLPPAAVLAGDSALAHYTELAEPRRPTVACTSVEWKRWSSTAPVTVLPYDDPDAVVVELWAYPPPVSATRGYVDPLSLYLSCRDGADDRLQLALDRLIETFPW